MLSPTLLDDAVNGSDDTPVLPTGNCSEVTSIQLHSAHTQQRGNSSGSSKSACNNRAMEPTRTSEKPLSQPTESVAVEAAVTVATEVAASAGDHGSKASIPSIPSVPTVPGSPCRKNSSPKKMAPRPRRIKRRGRFTIIELASDSPTSGMNDDDFYDRCFVTTTSTEETSVAMPLQLENVQLSRSADNIGHRVKPKRATRSMSRLQKSSGIRRSRRRSESPTREGIKAVDAATSKGVLQQQQDCANFQVLRATNSSNTLAKAAAVAASAGAYALTSTSSSAVSMMDAAISDNEFAVALTPTSSQQSSPTEQILSTNCCLVKPPQSFSTVSAAQYLQQQQTIASLIRQQHDLKQIISVLQEQQQQLLVIPSQINELKRQKINFNDSEDRDNEMRQLYTKVDALTATNESLHSLINAADREARHRILKIECLSEENDELRHRYGQLQIRYLDERKQGFVLEEELQRLRMLSLTLQEQHLGHKQQHSQKTYPTTA